MNRSVDRIQAAIIEKTENGVGSRVFHVAVNKETIGAWQRDLDRILIIFNVRRLAHPGRFLPPKSDRTEYRHKFETRRSCIHVSRFPKRHKSQHVSHPPHVIPYL